ncbi:MAG: hypothetical protein ACP5ER_01345, partial [Candidatus Bathyarchaeales archaeon]
LWRGPWLFSLLFRFVYFGCFSSLHRLSI